ncbi:MAG: 3-deoxy-D-manno-octulosonic acid transferase [Vicinamibacterales bacterium]
MIRLREGQTGGYTPPRPVLHPHHAGVCVYLLYSTLTIVVFVLGSPWFLWQALRRRKYVDGLNQRLGFLPITVNIDQEPSIWVHAVSVGEVLTTRALIEELRARYPRLKLFLSTTTLTGQRVAQSRVPGVDAVFYFPLDLPWTVTRTLNLLQPKLFVMMETEIWPQLLRQCHERGIKTVLVNGRISARSYPRYRLIRPFFRRVLEHIDLFCMQSAESAQRILDLGADPGRVSVTGSLKFDSLDWSVTASGRGQDRVLRFFRVSPQRVVLVAASTLKGEEGPVLTAFHRLRAAHPGALLILAPRHPDRFDDVVQLAKDEGFRVVRRSDLPIDAEPKADVVVLDTIGELARLFQVATLVFVGGSLVDAGGHNILEPAVFGKPILFGPSMHNFSEIAAAFLGAGAAIQVRTASDLTDAVLLLAGDPVRRASVGATARALVEANRGARERTLSALENVFPSRPKGQVVFPFRRPSALS